LLTSTLPLSCHARDDCPSPLAPFPSLISSAGVHSRSLTLIGSLSLSIDSLLYPLCIIPLKLNRASVGEMSASSCATTELMTSTSRRGKGEEDLPLLISSRWKKSEPGALRSLQSRECDRQCSWDVACHTLGMDGWGAVQSHVRHLRHCEIPTSK
jgi:hypothetical protein